MNPRSLAGAIAAVVMAASVAMGFEGYRETPYRDVGGVLTVCYGHTGVVEMRQYQRAECEAFLRHDMAEANAIVRRCVGREMPLNVEAALTDFTYNKGPGRAGKGADRGKDGFCILKSGKPSTIRLKAMAGDWAGVCEQFQYWTSANGIQYAGLVRRSAADRTLCEGKP